MRVVKLHNIEIPQDEIAEICQRYHVRELALFGSVLRDDFRDDSDVDVLVEFEPGTRIGFVGFLTMRDELTELLGRPVDLVSKHGLNPHLRRPVLDEAAVFYAA